jgi:pilus assembly protein CpaF
MSSSRNTGAVRWCRNISPKAIKEMIASAVHYGYSTITSRRWFQTKVMNITEIQGGLQERSHHTCKMYLFSNKRVVNKQGKIVGKFMATGFIPKFIETLEKKGYKIPRGLFNNQG